MKFIRPVVRQYLKAASFKRSLTFLIWIIASHTYATTLLVHGDSLSAGYGMLPEQTWVAQLQKSLGDQIKVVNTSISGETTQGGLARLPSLLAEHQPDYVLLELGANDGLRGYPLARMQNNLEQMIDLSMEAGAKVVLLGIRLPPNFGKRYTEPFYQTFDNLADQYQLPYLPFLLNGVVEHEKYMQSDRLHPTAEAQPLIMKNVLSILPPLN